MQSILSKSMIVIVLFTFIISIVTIISYNLYYFSHTIQKYENDAITPGKNYIVITSMAKYEISRKYLLESLKNNIAPSDIIIVLSGEENDNIYTDNETAMTIITQKRNIYEYVAFLVPNILPNVSNNDTFLLLHDTCWAGPNFVSKHRDLCDKFRENNIDILWCSPTGQCNICIFNKKTSDIALQLYNDMYSLDKMEAIRMEHDHSHHLSIKSNATLSQQFLDTPNPHMGEVKVYNDNHIRQKLYYTALDLEKYYVHVNRSEDHPNAP